MKNFRIDVILEDERRSASPVSVKLVARIAGIAIAAIILLVASVFVGSVLRVRARASRISAEWAKVAPKWKRAKSNRKDYDDNKAMLDEIKSWNRSRIEWHTHLMAVAAVVPEGVELEKMSIKGTIGVADGHAAMQFNMVLDGAARVYKKKSYTRSPQEDVMEFEKRLNTSASLSKVLAKVSVPPQFFTDDKTPGANKHDRKFKIMASYKPRKFLNETAKR